MSVMLYTCILCVALLMDLFVYVFDSVCELHGETIRSMFEHIKYNIKICMNQ